MTKKKVEIIEPKEKNSEKKKKINVCAYARVSTGSDEQKDSFLNQQKYYEDKIKANSDYNFVGVYADEAISGTTDKRPNFQRMIRLAENGYIDVIYTKSISRFSRNVVDLLSYCEKLKEHNVNIVFEENGIELLNSTGTLMLTILGAVAQMEVENTSDHINWTLQNKMQNGELVGQANPLGYDVVDGQLVINEEEAEIVRYIFQRYIEGAGANTIAKELERMGAKTKKNNTKWYDSTIIKIIKNEKYTGELIQGKTYTSNPIGHKRKNNRGESRLYRIENNHEAIITKDDWEKAQLILDKRCISYADGRRRGTTQNSSQSDFTSKLVCGYCGKHYSRRKIHAGTKYEKVIWNCSTVCKAGRENCKKSKPVEEEYLKQSVVGMINDLISDRNAFFYLSNDQVNRLMKKSEQKKDRLEEQIEKCRKNLQTKNSKKEKLLSLYLDGKITEKEFDAQRKTIENEIGDAQKLITELEKDINLEDKKNDAGLRVREIVCEGKTDEFNKELFDLIVDKVVVGGKRADGKDDPQALHFELIPYNLNTDLSKTVKNGTIHYKVNESLENILRKDALSKKQESELCLLNSDNTCRNGSSFVQTFP